MAPSEKIRLVYLVGQLGLGGSERQLALLLAHFDRSRFEVTVVVFNPSPYLVLNEQLLASGVSVVEIPPKARGIFARARFLYRLFREIRPQIVHSWTIHDNPYAGLIGRLAGVPVRWGSVRGSLRLKGFQGLPAPLRWLSVHGVSRQVVNARFLVEELVSAGLGQPRIHLLPNCTSLEEPEPFHGTAQLGIPAGARIVGTVGNLRRVKNQALLIAALGRVLPDFPDVHGLIVGQPLPDEPDLPGVLQGQIERLGLQGRVHLAGFQENVPGLLRSLSVFCLPSRSEGTPNALLEAMAAGLPVVAARVGGIPDVLAGGAAGYLFENGDVDGLEHALRTCLDYPEQAQALGRAGRKIIEQRFGCRQAVRQLAEAYQQAVAENCPA